MSAPLTYDNSYIIFLMIKEGLFRNDSVEQKKILERLHPPILDRSDHPNAVYLR
jgi:hypothetical protein